jgi:hypothetical protein
MPRSGNAAPLSAAKNESEQFDIHVRLLTKQELSRLIRKAPRSIDAMMKARTIPYLKLGRNVRFRLHDVERALARFTVTEVKLS